MRRLLPFVVALVIVGGCGTFRWPPCTGDARSDLVGLWTFESRITSSRPVCSPQRLEFRTDGTFTAHYDGCDFTPSERKEFEQPPSLTFSGTWDVGSYCPTFARVRTDPEFANTHQVVIWPGGDLTLVGQNSGMGGGRYARIGVDEVPDSRSAR